MNVPTNGPDDPRNVPKRLGKAPISVRESSAHLVSGRATRPPPAPVRRFTLDGGEWIARLAGEGYGGTGAHAPGFFAAVRFFRADVPDEPVREALVPRGRFDSLYDDELRDLFEVAETLDDDDDRPA